METVALAIASTLSLGWWLPQFVRTFRKGTDGISATSWAIYAVNTGVWTVWAYADRRFVLGTVDLCESIGATLIVARLRAWRPLAVVSAVVVAAITVVAAGLPGLVAAFGVVMAGAGRLPQLVRSWRGGTLLGVSTAAWLVSAAANITWILWAAVSGATPLVFGASTAVLMSTAIVVFTRRNQSRAARSLTAT